MSSNWLVLPTFRLADQFSRDMYGDIDINRFFNDQYTDGIFHAWPLTAHTGLRRSLGRNFDDMYRRHWADFTNDLIDNFGLNILCDRRPGAAVEGDKTVAESRPEHGFKVAMDLSGYTPEEISVKIKDGNTLRVDAKHEEKTEGKTIMRSYTREFTLPEDVDLDALKSNIDAGGVLSLAAPSKGKPAVKNVPIEREKSS